MSPQSNMESYGIPEKKDRWRKTIFPIAGPVGLGFHVVRTAGKYLFNFKSIHSPDVSSRIVWVSVEE